MRRTIHRASVGAVSCGVVLAVGVLAGFSPAGADSPPNPVQTTVQDVESAVAAAVPGTPAPAATPAPTAAASDPTAPLTGLPVSIAVPVSALNNELGTTLLPGQDSTSGTNTTTQSSPAANVDAPVNACSLSVGALANASSGCSTTTVGLDQTGAVGNVNVPVTAQDNAIGLINQAASALGMTTGQSPSSTTQDGAVNAFVPVTLCSVNVGLVGDTSSSCGLSGTNGSTSQQGVADATVPVTVCDVSAEIDGNSTASCPQETDTVSQSGQLADARRPSDGLWGGRGGRRHVDRSVQSRLRRIARQRPAE